MFNLSDMNWNAAIAREVIKVVPSKFAKVSETVRPSSNLAATITNRMRNSENTIAMFGCNLFTILRVIEGCVTV